MLKKIGRWLRYVFYCTSLTDLQDDIEHKRIDFNKHLVTIPTGTPLTRLVKEGSNPVIPTGIGEGFPGCRDGHRFVSSQRDFSPELYGIAQDLSVDTITMGTGSIILSMMPITAFKEVDNPQDKDWYELTLKSDIQVVELESICRALRIPYPLGSERHPVYHKFYGTHISGIRYKSFKPGTSLDELNILIYTDWLEDFKDIVDQKKLDKKSFITIHPEIIPYLNNNIENT